MTSAGPKRGGSAGLPSAAVRPHFTGRAAVLAIVLCAIALSLAYPVREYISQRRQIDQLEAQNEQVWIHRKQLEAENEQLHNPAYIEELARDQLHMCLPTQVCYVIIGQSAKRKDDRSRQVASPWYARVWSSVQQANSEPGERGARERGVRKHGVGKHGAGNHGAGNHGVTKHRSGKARSR
ncbi:MAG TPA: septum formation initiator family protein [Streptosporangiaceae bacterium]|nr:septum formation initiator family protein [Streptosporangiaceae bacterium]